MYVFEFLKFKKLIISIIMNYYFKNYKSLLYFNHVKDNVK